MVTPSTTATLLLLLCNGLVASVSSQVVFAAAAVIDPSGETTTTLSVESEVSLSLDGTDDNEGIGEASVTNKNNKKQTPLELANAQIDWLASRGGSFDREKIFLAPVPTEDENVVDTDADLGIFALEDIEEGDVLMRIPTSSVLASESTTDTCDAALTLLHEAKKTTGGNRSGFAPYIEYLYHGLLGGQENEERQEQRQRQRSATTPSVPSTWSPLGKSLLETIHGPNRIPQDMTKLSFFGDCMEGSGFGEADHNKLGEDRRRAFETAYFLARTRSWNEKWIPLLDMINHHRGGFNVATRVAKNQKQTTAAAPGGGGDGGAGDGGGVIEVYAATDIWEGEELFLDYTKRNRDTKHHASTLLRDFGFVELYPQRWKLPTPSKRSNIEENQIPVDITFDVVLADEETDDDDESEERGESFDIRWVEPGKPLAHPVAAEYLRNELARLEELEAHVLETSEDVVSEHERNTLVEYHRSLVVAYGVVVASIDEAIEDAESLPVDNPGDDFMACDDFEALHDETFGWEFYDGTISSHQGVDFYYNGETRDSCLFLDEYLHACTSNRPHYHEVFVHYPARFLDKVERVLFIGGGDSMVLHEVLKYEDQLELVVGLELDQHVVRKTYALMGTQPHFHNDKVEWWFGDAAKTLNVLPTEYYGTFDLVVVDILSEVAESLEVTADVTIMEAAMMLMKPNGIIVKNEDEGYVPGNTNAMAFTEHAIDVMYYDVPIYCLQTFVVGSNAVDFSEATPKDHNVSNFYLKGVDEFQGQFDTWYTSGKKTYEETEKDEDNDGSASSTIGLTMVVEAEEISVPLDSPSDVKNLLNKRLEAIGMTVTTTFEEEMQLDGFLLVSLLEEGCVTARCFSDKKYCAIDIQLWKNAHVAEAIRKDLLSSLGSEEASVYRVITTGIYGAEENENNPKIGPPSKESTILDRRLVSEMDGVVPEKKPSSFAKRKNPKIDFKNATMEDYDTVSALEQWHSQEPIGHQVIAKFELEFDFTHDVLKEMQVKSLNDALAEVSEEWEDDDVDQINVEAFDVGVGFVVIATWSEGNVVGVWDGGNHYDVTIFSMEQSSRANHRAVQEPFRRFFNHVATDSFPRGTGRVINIREDFASDRKGNREHPFWAPPSKDSSVVDGYYRR